jgi:hypothetical protein
MDNVFIERLWRSLKHEDIYLKGYADGREAKAGIACESACDLTPNRLPTLTLVGHTINSSIQCVAMRGLGSDSDADRAPDLMPNNILTQLRHKAASVAELASQPG